MKTVELKIIIQICKGFIKSDIEKHNIYINNYNHIIKFMYLYIVF